MVRTVIKPTIGRIVWYWVAQPSPQIQPMAAIVASVVDEAHVNLAVFDAAGTSHGEHNVLLVQEGDHPSTLEAHCEWMPYQKQVASGQIPPVQHK